MLFRPDPRPRAAALASLQLAFALACSPTDNGPSSGTGGATASGGATPVATGGATTGGTSGGASLTGGAPAGGTPVTTGGVVATATGGSVGLGGGGGAAGGGGSVGASSMQGGAAGSASGGSNAGAGNNAGRGGSGGTAGGGAASGGKAQTGGAGGNGNNGGSAGLGGSSLCENGTFILCESFEGTEVGAIPSGWTRDGNAQLVQVASDQAARGQRALKLGAAANGARRLTRSASNFGAAHWGRLFYRVQTPPPMPSSGGVIHSTIAALEGTGPTIGAAEYRVVDTVENSNGMHQYLYNVQPSGGEFGKGSSYDYRYDGSWHCTEWQVDATTQSYHFYVDGTEVTQIAISNGAGNNGSGSNRSELSMTFSQFRIGWNNYQSASPGFVAWVDEVAIASTRIGCNN